MSIEGNYRFEEEILILKFIFILIECNFRVDNKLIILLYYRDETRNDFHRYRFHHFEQW